MAEPPEPATRAPVRPAPPKRTPSALEQQLSALVEASAMVVDSTKEADKSAKQIRRKSRDLSSQLADMELQVSTMQGAAGVWRSLRRKGSSDLSDEALRAAFDAIDLDKSGTVEKEELRKAIMEANPLATEKVIQDMLRFADTDGDGTVDFEEYKTIMRSGADQPQG